MLVGIGIPATPRASLSAILRRQTATRATRTVSGAGSLPSRTGRGSRSTCATTPTSITAGSLASSRSKSGRSRRRSPRRPTSGGCRRCRVGATHVAGRGLGSNVGDFGGWKTAERLPGAHLAASRDAHGPMLAVQRRIEARIGQLLGEPRHGVSGHDPKLIPHDSRADFRLLGPMLAVQRRGSRRGSGSCSPRRALPAVLDASPGPSSQGCYEHAMTVWVGSHPFGFGHWFTNIQYGGGTAGFV